MPWTEFKLPGQQICGSAFLPEVIGGPCLRVDGGDAHRDCVDGADQLPGICLKHYERCADLMSSELSQASTMLPVPGAESLPSGLYASALSAAIAAGARLVGEAPYIVGRAAVTGFLMWNSTDQTQCKDLASKNATCISEDLNQGQPMRTQPQVRISDLMPLLPSMRCDMDPTDPFTRAVQVPPWVPATHFHVQLYLLQNVSSQDSEAGTMPANTREMVSGRRLLQGGVDQGTVSPANAALLMIFQDEKAHKAAAEAMEAALVELMQFIDIDPPDVLPQSLLPNIMTNIDEPQDKNMSVLHVSLGVGAAAALLLVVMVAICCLLRRKTPSPSPRTYVASAEGVTEPILPPERREQLKGLLKWLRRKRTEEMNRARTRPLGEPIELDPEPVARTKVENIVKSLLCASAPGPGVVAELSCVFPLLTWLVVLQAFMDYS